MENKRIKILIAETQDFSPQVVKRLEKYADVELRSCTEGEISKALEDYDIFWFRLGHQLTEKLLSNPNNRCKVLATPVTGIDHIDEEACRNYGVKIICLRGEKEFLKKVRATAELTIGLTLALIRNIPMASNSVKSGEWSRDLFRGNELYGKTAGIIGFGRLGEIVADYLLAFGMEVIVYDILKVPARSGITVAASLTEIAQKCDLISLHVNYNESTKHLIGDTFFNNCKTDAVFINTSRGGIVDEKSLLKALVQNKIKGAALDVLQGEPAIGTDHPLVRYAQQHTNLIILPHIGGNTYESFQKTEEFIADKIIEHLQ